MASASSKESLWFHYPYKAVYSAVILVTLPLRLTFIFLYYIPSPLRQHPKWTYRQAVGLEIFLIWWRYTAAVRYHTSKSLEPGSLKERFIIMRPPHTRPSIYRGIARDTFDRPISTVQPMRVGAVWYPAPLNPARPASQRVAIHFHGGAYVLGGCRPMESGWGPLVLAKHLQGPVLQVQYRLAVDMSVGFRACFPAALQDGLTAYSYVINELGVPPGNVVLSGESAGANLVIAMLRYLSSDDGKGTLPLPRAGLLWSPWVNLVPNQLTLDEHQNGRSDYMKGSILEWGASLFTPHGFDRRNPYISPLGNEFKSPVPLFVHSGTAEVLHDEHVSFAKAMRTCGTELEFLESENAPHDIFGAGIILGFVDEAEVAVQKAIAFVERVTHSHNE